MSNPAQLQTCLDSKQLEIAHGCRLKITKHLHNLSTLFTIGYAHIPFKQSVRNLGFSLD